MQLTLTFVRETDMARLYENKDGARQWVPRSVCVKTMKWPAEAGKLAVHDVTIQDWWLQKNPWPSSKQQNLFAC